MSVADPDAKDQSVVSVPPQLCSQTEARHAKRQGEFGVGNHILEQHLTIILEKDVQIQSGYC